MASQEAIQQVLAMLEPKGLGNTPRPISHGSARQRAKAIQSLTLSWVLELADISDEDLLRAYVLWARSSAGKWWPQPSVLLEHCPGRLRRSAVERAAVEAYSELWARTTQYGCGPEEPANEYVYRSWLKDADQANDPDQIALCLMKARQYGPRWHWKCGNNDEFRAAAKYTLRKLGGWRGLLAERSRCRQANLLAEVEAGQRKRWKTIFVRFLMEEADKAEEDTVNVLLDRAGRFGRSIAERTSRSTPALPEPLQRQLVEHLSEGEVIPHSLLLVEGAL